MPLNNVDLKAIEEHAEAIKKEPSSALRLNRIEIDWQAGAGQPQMATAIKYEGGEFPVEIDSPRFMGGQGLKPGPIHYCILGMVSCFTATFVTAASAQGISFRRLKSSGQCEIDFSRVFGVSDNPTIRAITFMIEADCDASLGQLEAAREEALARCPAVYAMSNQISMHAEVRTAH